MPIDEPRAVPAGGVGEGGEDLVFEVQLAGRRDAAATGPAVVPVGAGAVEHDVGAVDPLNARAVLDEQPEAAGRAVGLADRIRLVVLIPTDAQHGRIEP